MNKTIQSTIRTMIKDLLSQCTLDQQSFFIRIYSHENQNLSIDEVIKNISDDKLEAAFSLCERTINKNK